jgi:hypothetical protein
MAGPLVYRHIVNNLYRINEIACVKVLTTARGYDG